jgi:hypothetical protein
VAFVQVEICAPPDDPVRIIKSVALAATAAKRR